MIRRAHRASLSRIERGDEAVEPREIVRAARRPCGAERADRRARRGERDRVTRVLAKGFPLARERAPLADAGITRERRDRTGEGAVLLEKSWWR